MLMPKKNLVAIYEHLFKEGVMVAKKDTHAPKHPELDVPNLQVMKTLNSLKSRGYVKEQVRDTQRERDRIAGPLSRTCCPPGLRLLTLASAVYCLVVSVNLLGSSFGSLGSRWSFRTIKRISSHLFFHCAY